MRDDVTQKWQQAITAAIWLVVASALAGSLLFSASRVALMVVTIGMYCDSGCADVMGVMGGYSVLIIALIGAIVLIVWHVDRWPYRLAAPVMLAVAILGAPLEQRHQWFWWLGF